MKEGDPGWMKEMYGIDSTFKSDCNLYLATIENLGPRGGVKKPDYSVIRGDLLPFLGDMGYKEILITLFWDEDAQPWSGEKITEDPQGKK